MNASLPLKPVAFPLEDCLPPWGQHHGSPRRVCQVPGLRAIQTSPLRIATPCLGSKTQGVRDWIRKTQLVDVPCLWSMYLVKTISEILGERKTYAVSEMKLSKPPLPSTACFCGRYIPTMFGQMDSTIEPISKIHPKLVSRCWWFHLDVLQPTEVQHGSMSERWFINR